MIEIFIFYLHIVSAIYVFVKNWQNRTLKDAFLGLGVFALVFSIGWALTGSLAYAIYPDKWKTPYFNHDTLSLVLLAIFESIFFYHFFFKDNIDEKNNQEVAENG